MFRAKFVSLVVGSSAVIVLASSSGARAATWHVDGRHTGPQYGSTTAPLTQIQSAIAASQWGDTILVAAGTYPERVVIADRRVQLRGGYAGASAEDYAAGAGGDFATRDPAAHPTIVVGQLDGPTFELSNCGGTEVDGFVITGGLQGVRVTAAEAGLSSPRIANNLIEGNGVADRALVGGGVVSDGADLHLIGNVIRDNIAGRGAGVSTTGGQVLLELNRIERNRGYDDHAGGVYVSGHGRIVRNLIADNQAAEGLDYGWGGGLLIYDFGTEITVSHNRITRNYAPSEGGGVFIDDQATVYLDHDLIDHNRTGPSSLGGQGIYVDGLDAQSGTRAILTHCTVADHHGIAEAGGRGLFVANASSVDVAGSIFWGNEGEDFWADESSRVTVAYSTTQEPVSGVGNQIADPLFVSPDSGDYQLRSRYGRWDQSAAGGLGAWINDPASSPAIDHAAPSASFFAEPQPNGGRANQGHLGGTGEASRSAMPGPPAPADAGTPADGGSDAMITDGRTGSTGSGCSIGGRAEPPRRGVWIWLLFGAACASLAPRTRRRARSALTMGALTMALLTGACREISGNPGSELGPNADLASSGDGAAPDLTALKPSPCPAPGVVSPSQIPSDFLPAITVDIQYVVDGDTADFVFPAGSVILGKQTVRFIYVNTEESHGTETTNFGIKTAQAVTAMFTGAHKYEVALERKSSDPSQPAKDTFGRYLGLVFVDGDLFQTRLVREGWSAYYTQFGCASNPVHDALLHAEAEANVNDRGIWATGHPTDYNQVFQDWIGSKTCRPNPFNSPYCK